MKKNSTDVLRDADIAKLQRARIAIEEVKRAMYMGKRGSDWLTKMKCTFNSLSYAQTLLQTVVTGQHLANREEMAQSTLKQVAAQINNSRTVNRNVLRPGDRDPRGGKDSSALE